MSFLVVFNSDGAGVDLQRLERMNPMITARHARVLGKSQHVAFVEAEAGSDVPPGDAPHCIGLHGVWLAGCVRLDGHKELYRTVVGTVGQEPDALLCLRAYARWGDRFLEKLGGDFCFALWDEDRQRLLCGRDQLGVRPLFYAIVGASVVVSDSIELITSINDFKP